MHNHTRKYGFEVEGNGGEEGEGEWAGGREGGGERQHSGKPYHYIYIWKGKAFSISNTLNSKYKTQILKP